VSADLKKKSCIVFLQEYYEKIIDLYQEFSLAFLHSLPEFSP
jgi:hypothetical protein